MHASDHQSQNTSASAEITRKRTGRRPARRRKFDSHKDGMQSFWKYLLLLPLLIAMGVVPLVVYLKITPVPPEYQQFWVTDTVFDFFSYYKASIVIACAGLVLVSAFGLYLLGRLPRKHSTLYIPLATYSALLVASTFASEHQVIALGGFFDRAEGMWVLLAYVVLLVGTYLFVTEVKQAWLVLVAWAAALGIICILGIFQFFGFDFFKSLSGRLLILPAQYHNLAPVLNFSFPEYYIYGTLYNPNNVASMMSLAFPLAAVGFLFSRSRKRQVVFGILAGLSCLTLIGSKGRSAWIAVLFALVLVVVFSISKGMPGWWKRLSILVLVVVLEFGALSFASRGPLSRWDPLSAAIFNQAWEAGPGQAVVASEPTIIPVANEDLPGRLIRQFGTMMSGRVYIWIRSLQMAGKTVFLGHGPDTFALYFPNNDPYKSAYYGQPQTFIDKPHNMYLQSWLNLGGLATLAFLAMLGLHTASTFRVLRQADPAGDRFMLALGLYAGWFAYLVACFFYDSSVSVAPAFWIIFGLSMAMNKLLGAGSFRKR